MTYLIINIGECAQLFIRKGNKEIFVKIYDIDGGDEINKTRKF